jgi:hypothetical protein
MAQELNLPVGYSYAVTSFTGNGYLKGASVTWGFKNPTTGSSPQILADDLKSAINTAFGTPSALYRNDFTLSKVTAKNGPVATGAFYDEVVSIILGASTTDAYASNCAVLVHKQTLLGGRKGSGRMYWPAPVESAIDNGGVLTESAVSTIQGYIDSITGFMTDAGWIPQLLHRFDNTLPESPTPPTVILTHRVEQVVATQRRRLVRR